VRIPYLSALANKENFLYANTDVAIWSGVETALAIAASSFATLRPLFRTFLAENKLFGGSNKQREIQLWPAGRERKQGYARSCYCKGDTSSPCDY